MTIDEYLTSEDDPSSEEAPEYEVIAQRQDDDGRECALVEFAGALRVWFREELDGAWHRLTAVEASDASLYT